MKGVVLLSGGMDSAVVAWIARQACDELYALTFQYGQTHEHREVRCAIDLGKRLNLAGHMIFPIDLKRFGGSALYDKKVIPTHIEEGIASTWVPQRNTIFLVLTHAWAEVLGCDVVYIGVNQVDYSGYPDCRSEFIVATQNVLDLGSPRFIEGKGRIEILTPIINMTKAAIVRCGEELGVPWKHTWSCYKGGAKPCMACPSCLLRKKGFDGAGVKDPLLKKEVEN